MTEEIIIDGVDVAGCEHYTTMEDCDGIHDLCEQLDDYCSIKKNCYYKQLKRLEQENKELKETVKDLNQSIQNCNIQRTKMYKALEEINRVVKLAHKVEDYLLGQDYTDLVDGIEKEIDEVLK